MYNYWSVAVLSELGPNVVVNYSSGGNVADSSYLGVYEPYIVVGDNEGSEAA